MELKDRALVLICSAALLLALGIFTDSIVFYIIVSILAAAIVADNLYYRYLIRDLRRHLHVAKQTLQKEQLLGSHILLDYRLEYTGKRSLRLHCVQLLDQTLVADHPEREILLKNGIQHILFDIRPSRRGQYVVPGLRMTLESWLFRGAVTGGGDSPVNINIALKRVSTNASMRNSVRSSLIAGGEATRHGAGSDFSSIRGYQPGDSIKNIDWARSSKSDTLIVRDFEDVRTLPVFLLIDIDASMQTGAPESELDSAIEIGVSISNSVLLDNERVGLACFTGKDVVRFMPLGSSKDHQARLINQFLTLNVANEALDRPSMPMIHLVVSARNAFEGSTDLEGLRLVMGDAIDRFSANVREDGLFKAVSRASLAGTQCHIIVITNLSMGIQSLLHGVRIARYNGHRVTVIVTPHIWFDSVENTDPGRIYEMYQDTRAIVTTLRSLHVNVIEMSVSDKPEKEILRHRIRGSNIRR